MSPSRRRKAVNHLKKNHTVSERRACKVACQHRSTQRYQPQKRVEEEQLLKDMHKLVLKRPRFGCRRIARLLRDDGWVVNYKRVHRLWKQEGFRVPPKRKKKRYIGTGANACDKRKSFCKNDVWTLDFIHDRLVDGRQFKCLAILDEFTRENLALTIGRSITGDSVLNELSLLMGQLGIPSAIRSDNGPEFVSIAVRNWLKSLGVEALFIEPGAPWQNGFVESFNSRFRDEFLDMEIFYNIKEVQILAGKWREDYNEKRPHSSLGYMTPSRFAECLEAAGSASLRPAPPAASKHEIRSQATVI